MIKNLIIISLGLAVAILFKMVTIKNIEAYNLGYKRGMLYAYDNVVVCGASPEDEGVRMARILGEPSEVSSIICEE